MVLRRVDARGDPPDARNAGCPDRCAGKFGARGGCDDPANGTRRSRSLVHRASAPPRRPLVGSHGVSGWEARAKRAFPEACSRTRDAGGGRSRPLRIGTPGSAGRSARQAGGGGASTGDLGLRLPRGGDSDIAPQPRGQRSVLVSLGRTRGPVAPRFLCAAGRGRVAISGNPRRRVGAARRVGADLPFPRGFLRSCWASAPRSLGRTPGVCPLGTLVPGTNVCRRVRPTFAGARRRWRDGLRPSRGPRAARARRRCLEPLPAPGVRSSGHPQDPAGCAW